MSRIVFLVSYLLFMLPTYVLPYFGSNSWVAHSVASASRAHPVASAALNILMALHVLALVALVVIAHARGTTARNSRLVAFPIVAAAFDMLPLLSMVPLVPTVLHAIVLVLGMQKAAHEPD